jgi:hypothetical protein
MPAWAWVLSVPLALLGLAALALALFRVRYRLEWRGEWNPTLAHPYGDAEGSVVFEYGFPGFRKRWEPFQDKSWSIGDLLDDEEEDEAARAQKNDPGEKPGNPENKPKAEGPPMGRKSGVAAGPVPGFSEAAEPPFFRDRSAEGARAAQTTQYNRDEVKTSPEEARKARMARNKKRRALFRLATDTGAWRLLGRYGVRAARLFLGLLKPRIEAAVGHPDPAFLGRLSGKWFAARPLLPLGRTEMYFRFQDRHPSLWVKAEGGFSALSVLGFGIRLLVAFPSIGLARRAIRSWRHHKLTGWRAWAYRRLQTRG